MAFPEPEVGLVVSYSYLWSEEAAKGRVEGRKDRPCAIVLSVKPSEGKSPTVVVVPITHSPPRDPSAALEIPQTVKHHLGLDSETSWIVLDDFNVFTWPGYDLRPIPNRNGRYEYGLLPPKLFAVLVRKFKELRRAGKGAQTSRDDAG
jgi:hypothetical protein